METKTLDVLVLGAGIAGITAGIYLKRSNLSCAVLDKDAPGGKLNNIHQIDNYPGFSSIAGPDLAMALVGQANELNVPLDYGEVSSVKKLDDGRFLTKTDNGDYVSLAIIVATGVINAEAGVPNERKMRGKGVSYCATCDGNFFKGKDVMVYGYKDHAVEDVIYLSSICKTVYFVSPSVIESVPSHMGIITSKENVKMISGKLISIEGEERVEGARIEEDGKEKTLPVSAVFPLAGEVSSTQFLSLLDVEQTNGFIHVEEDMSTNVAGLYAAGDIVKKKLRQLVNAAGEGAVAASSAISYAHTEKRRLGLK